MCGINGIFAYHYAANSIEVGELERTRDHMASRGPDGSGMWLGTDGRIGLGHRRLAIIDRTDAAAQPMLSADGQLVVTFNGEIYNYRDLRRELEGRGCVFRSRSDTEVLLHLYSIEGPAMVDGLRGMFAFCIWDARRRTLFLARDAHGIKPLYYADDGWTFRCASQVKALTAGGGVSNDLEPAGIVGFHLFGSVPEPFTLLSDVRALPAGCTLLVDRFGAGVPRQYYSVAAQFADPPKSVPPAGRHEVLRAAFLDSAKSHLVSDVRVGCLLSGGVDSGALLGLTRDSTVRSMTAITVVFSDFENGPENEAIAAAAIARSYEADHSIRVVTPEEIKLDMPSLIASMDQPSIDGVNMWFAAKAARELGLKVVIAGLGGDELLGGYSSFTRIPWSVAAMRGPSLVPLLGRSLRRLLQPVGELTGAHPKLPGVVELGGSYAGAYLLQRGLFMPWELSRLLDPDIVRTGLSRLDPSLHIARVLQPRPPTAFGKVATLETSLYMRNQLLRDADWASMAHGVEVRTPLVDRKLSTTVARYAPCLRVGEGKAILAGSPRTPLPHVVARRPKMGFVAPVATLAQRLGSERAASHAAGDRAELPARTWGRRIAQCFMM